MTLTTEIQKIRGDLFEVWREISPDAGDYGDAAELILDRIGGDAGKTLSRLCKTYGANKVVDTIDQVMFG